MVTLENLLQCSKKLGRKMCKNIEFTVRQKLEDIAKEQGHITRPMVEKLFKIFSDEIQN